VAPPLADPDEALVRDVARNRDLLLRLLSVNASLAGLCIAGLGFIEFGAPKRTLQTLADEAIAVCTLFYVGNVYLILWALRTRDARRAWRLGRVIDWVFVATLTTMVIAGGYLIFGVL
jgi:hypothetical protein